MKGGFTMLHYRAVKSGIDIAMQIADLLESLSIGEQDSRAAIIRNGNDVLQGRSDMSIDMLLSALRETGGHDHSQEVDRIQAQIEAFLNQMALRGKPYRKTGCQEYEYKLWDFDPQHPLKVIEQELFDHAAEHGFPPDFFKDAYFDHVTVYCMPDGTDCSGSHFQDCSFTACGIRGAVFDNAVIYDTQFHSVFLRMVNFTEASIAHTHFRDSDFSSVSFLDARLKSCLTVDCSMDRVDFQGATLDGTSFDRINASRILNLSSANITWSGATDKDVWDNRASIFRVMGVPLFPVRQRPLRQKKYHAPER